MTQEELSLKIQTLVKERQVTSSAHYINALLDLINQHTNEVIGEYENIEELSQKMKFMGAPDSVRENTMYHAIAQNKLKIEQRARAGLSKGE